ALRREIQMIVIAGGGTGGHTSPGLAVAAALRARGIACEWIGSRTGLEARRAPEAGIPYHAIRTGKLRRALAWQNVPDVFVNRPAGVLQAWRLLRRLRPRVVLATGGFVALPVALAGALARVPVVVHEQTAVPGLANRVAARVARRVAVTFAESADVFGGTATVVTGNPLRPELRTGRRAAALERFGFDPALPVVYVTGGAQGSHAINRAIGEVLAELLTQTQVVHQSGDNHATGDRVWLQARRGARAPAPSPTPPTASPTCCWRSLRERCGGRRAPHHLRASFTAAARDRRGRDGGGTRRSAGPRGSRFCRRRRAPRETR